MKKIMALVLAAAMLSTTAFAATVNIGAVGASTVAKPGDTLRIAPEFFGVDGKTTVTLKGIDWRLSTEYFSITAKKFDKGANLVKEVKINDDKNTVDVVLNTNYELAAPKGQNLVIKELSIKAKKEYVLSDDKKWETGEIKKGETYTYCGEASAFHVGYPTNENTLGQDDFYEINELVKFVKGEDKDDPSYATVSYEDAA
ncbi:MAG: hypothetical protein RR461_04570, partial [Angelakisella sp.]